MKEESIRKITKIVKKTLSAIWWVFIIALALLLVNIFSSKLRGKVPKVFGYSVMYIVSGSMESTIPEGTYILIKECDPKEIKKDDIICFYSDDPVIKGYPNTHRVVSEPEFTEDGLIFKTRGDASKIDDAYPARAENLIGKHVKNLNGLTNFTIMLSNGGMIVIIVILAASVMLLAACSIFVKSKHESDDSTNE